MLSDDSDNLLKLQSINRELLNLGPDHLENMNRITEVCGQLFNASTALYNRLENGLLCSLGKWNTPDDYNGVDQPQGHICYDVIQKAIDDIYLVENLGETVYFQTDPNVAKYNLVTYVGHMVKCNSQPVGSLCVVFQHPFKPTEFDRFVIGFFARALGHEESLEQFRQSKNRYHDLFEFSVGGLLTGSAEGIITDANQRFSEISGFKKEQLIGRFIGDVIFTPESLEDKPLRFDRLKNGEIVVSEREIIHANGHRIPVEMHSKMMPDGSYQSVYHDITERKKADQALIASEQKQRLLLSTIPVAIYVSPVDPDSDLEYFAGNVVKLTGFAEEDFLVKKDLWRSRLHPDDREKVLNAYQNPETNKEIVVEYRWMVADGSYKWFLDKSYLTDTGEKPEFLGMMLDMTQRKIALEEIKKQNEELHILNREKDNFFSILAHDLRSPFNGFLGLTYLLTEEIHNMSLPEILEISMSLRKSATNMYALLENLLEWSRVHRGVLKFEPEPMILMDLVSRAIDPVTESARNKKIAINFNIPEQLSVLADPHMAETIIRNLTSNSVKFTHKGGRISIRATRTENGVVAVSIEDNGIGMNDDLVNRLFNINEIIKKPGTDGEPSSGLGLIICKEFIGKHNGEIRVSSREGFGTTMTFTLPANV